MQIDKLTYLVIGAAIKVHRHFGAGFTEEIYKNSLFIELNNMGLKSEKEVNLDILYDNTPVGYFKADIIVEKKLIIELKAINQLLPTHELQLIKYLSASGIGDGLLLNFGTKLLQIKRKFRPNRTQANPKQILNEMLTDGIIVPEGQNKITPTE
jgi:GxxExxY protein